jgi:hypothetical protein
MIRGLLFSIILPFVPSVNAAELTGRLKCMPLVSKDSKPGLFEAMAASRSNEQYLERSPVGDLVSIDLQSPSNAPIPVITKTFTNKSVFDGEIKLEIALIYRGEIESGNLHGVSLDLKHQRKDILSRKRTVARASGRFLLLQNGMIHLELSSPKGGLGTALVDCIISGVNP